MIHTPYLAPFGMFVFILFYAVLIAAQFSRAYSKNLALKKELDIRQKRETGLRLVRRRLAAMLHQMEDAVVAVGPDMGIWFWNQAFETLTGHGRESLEGLPAAMLFREEARAGVRELMERAWQKKDPSPEDKRQLAVKIMNEICDYWVRATETTKVELADRSGLWNVYIDKDGWARTQTLDKYLALDTLPSRPRWSTILKTAEFILAACDTPSSLRRSIEQDTARIRNC